MATIASQNARRPTSWSRNIWERLFCIREHWPGKSLLLIIFAHKCRPFLSSESSPAWSIPPPPPFMMLIFFDLGKLHFKHFSTFWQFFDLQNHRLFSSIAILEAFHTIFHLPCHRSLYLFYKSLSLQHRSRPPFSKTSISYMRFPYISTFRVFPPNRIVTHL